MNETEIRALLIKASDDRPPGLDVMPVPVPVPARRRRFVVAAVASLGVAATVGAIVLALPYSQPTALAQVAAAVENTGSDSYRIHVQAGARTWDGAVDPTRHTGIITESGNQSESRFIGDVIYSRRQGEPGWTAMRRDEVAKGAPAGTLLVKLAPLDPQAALERLRSATDVRESGPASGEGWTGHRFAFTLADKVTVTGVVDVDEQARVRHLEVTFSDNGQRDVMDFGDFGADVAVTAPPADQVRQEPPGKPDVKKS